MILSAWFASRAVPLTSVSGDATVPLRFRGAVAEHLATRLAAGLFDFSFMACIEVEGRDSCAFLERIQTRRIRSLPPGRLAYTLMLNDDGSVLNDATVWRHPDGRWWLFTGRRSDRAHIVAVASGFRATLTDLSDRIAVIALQGPATPRVLDRVAADFPRVLPYFRFEPAGLGSIQSLVGRLGYSGEAGVELVVRSEVAVETWQALLSAGNDCEVTECGFEATDSLRIESGYMLFLREFAVPVYPEEVGLSRLVDAAPGGGSFIGAQNVRMSGRPRPLRRLVGLVPTDRAQLGFGNRVPTFPTSACPAPGCATMTSQAWSPVFGRWIGLGFVHADDRWPGTIVRLHDGSPVRVCRLPFYDPGRRLPRQALRMPRGPQPG